MNTVLWGQLAGACSTIAFLPYIVSILRKKSSPNRATWIIWTVVSGVIAGSYYAVGATSTIWVPVGYTIGSLIIAILSLKYGEGGLERLDKNCFIVSVLGLLGWLVSSSPLVALFANMVADSSGSLPTIKKVFKDPTSEDKLTWLLFWLGALANVLAIDDWRFVIYAYPLDIAILVTMIAGLVWFWKK
ncbi:MAG: hypothetical protein ACKKL5_03420 [Candidatus Komeilibacteria bacterium]